MSLPPLSRLQAPPLPSALPPLALSLPAPEAAKLAAQFQALPATAVGQSAPQTVAQLPATVVQSTPVPAAEGGGVALTLRLPNGATLQARSPVPVPLGSVVQLPQPPLGGPATPVALAPEVILPIPPLPAPNSAGVSNTALPPAVGNIPQSPSQPVVILRVILQPAVPTPAVSAASQSVAPPVNFQLSTLQLSSPTPQPSPLVVYPARTAVPGPVPLQLQTPLPPSWEEGQPLTLRLTTPTTGTLQPQISSGIPTFNTPAVAVLLLAELNLPVRNDIPVLVGKNIAFTQEKLKSIPQTQVIAQVLPGITNNLVNSAPPTATPLLQALRLLVPPNTPVGEQLARVLPSNIPNQQPSPPNTQPVLLATGQVALLEIPESLSAKAAVNFQPSTINAPLNANLPAGTVLRVNIPTLSGPAQILQLHSNQPQLLPQGPNQAAPSTPVQTPQAVLAAGSVVSGIITGQNAQGQPILTLTAPTPQAGQSFTLTLGTGTGALAPNSGTLAATLVVGSKVQISVGENGVAQLLGLELPPAAARATTLASLGGSWERLQQTLNTLQNTSPNLAAQARANLPALANFLPGLMRLLEAVNTKDPSKLLGESAKLASALGPDLTADLGQLQQLLAKNPEDPTQWRGFIFPYVQNPDGQPQQGSFMFRREEEDDARSSTATRFVAELNLSQLGPVQLDGLVTYPEIWLKLRVQQAPPTGFSEGLQAIIGPLLAKLQLAGGISVETTSTFPLSPAADLRAAAEAPLGLGV